MRYVVIINEAHSLLPEQEAILNQLGSWEFLKVPKGGWKLKKIRQIGGKLASDRHRQPVFVSPIPAMMRVLNGTKWMTFHNDHREKKELPNGLIRSVVAKTGWQLV